ncbi:FAD-dependent oxidoreductase [Dietzia sp. NCCP-2495]|uniref:FAD-dependent oxidoreductase n=1 Tax=Dietzia sp. NCCP-2495 TaxID=2934675 RepID=UPI0022302841|nr:FAD-dependent oxidoreductase [Dietzia sp. NCCP-2495]
MSRTLRIAIVGAGPAGTYAADIVTSSELPAGYDGIAVDVFDADPTPFGLIRYGVAPDHPRIKEIVKALNRVMSKPEISFHGNLRIGRDVSIDELRAHYDAIVMATGARKDADLNIPGVELEGSFGAADFVSWYDAHPDAPQEWEFRPEATSVAVLGMGNVALDVARVLAKTAEEMLVTEIPDHVHEGLAANPAVDVHVFGRRGPAQAKFSPMELRELAHSPNVDVIVHPEGFEFDEGSEEYVRQNKSQRLVVNVLTTYLAKDPKPDAACRIHLHFGAAPTEILGEDGRVTGLRTEVSELDGTGNARGTGEFVDWEVGAVYRAIGYKSDPIEGLPFDFGRNVIPNDGGRVLDESGEAVPGAYVTGWVKRGPIGLIGHTKSDAQQTITHLLEDLAARGVESADGIESADGTDGFEGLRPLLDERGITTTDWDGWVALDEHERTLGETDAHPRERVKVATREEMVRVAAGALTH